MRQRTTRLDRKITRQARKNRKRAELRIARRVPVSGIRLLVVAGAVVVVAAGAWWVNSLFADARPDTAPLATHSPTRSAVLPGGTGTPTPGSAVAEGAGNAAAAVLDREDPEAVVQAWARAYLERSDPFGDTSWMDVLSGFTSAPVISQLRLQAFGPEQILDGKAPTTLGVVDITAPAADAEKNTPVRWSRTVTAHVTGADGSVSVIAFGVVMIHTLDGWEITSVEEISVSGGES